MHLQPDMHRTSTRASNSSLRSQRVRATCSGSPWYVDCCAGLPAAPSHDPEMPSAPKFSHTGVVYETSIDEADKGDQVQDDLLERFKRLQG